MRSGEDKGLVLEQKGRKLTVVTPSGEFMTIKTKIHDLPVLPGSTVDIPSTQRGFGFALRRRLPAVALSAFLVVSILVGYQGYLYARPAFAYMTFDAHGSIELEVNDRGFVRSATAFDENGARLLSGVKYRMRPFEQVANALIEAQALDEVGDEEIEDFIIAIVPVSENMDEQADRQVRIMQRLEQRLKDCVRDVQVTVSQQRQQLRLGHGPAGSAVTDGFEGDEAAPIRILNLNMEAREAARELGLSAGQAAARGLCGQGCGNGYGPGDGTGNRCETPDCDGPVVDADGVGDATGSAGSGSGGSGSAGSGSGGRIVETDEAGHGQGHGHEQGLGHGETVRQQLRDGTNCGEGHGLMDGSCGQD